MCQTSAHYAKLRLVAAEDSGRIVALFELSFGLVAGDIQPYQRYDIPLDPATTCRFGPCITDACQNRGLGSRRLSSTLDIARRFGRTPIVLWGGVRADKQRASHYCRRHGFQIQGQFTNTMGILCYDMVRFLSDAFS